MIPQTQHGTRTGNRLMDVRVPAAPRVVSEVRDAMADLALPPRLLDDARLLLSELLSNSIRHAGLSAGDFIRVRAQWSGARLRVDVWDRPGEPRSSPLVGAIRPDPGGESGWGLYLVDIVASRWGSAPGRWWFELEHGPGAERRA